MADLNNPFLSHLLARLHSDLDFLNAQNLLSNADLSLFKAKLPSATGASASGGLEAQFGGLSVGGSMSHASASGAGSQQQCRALWDYAASQPDDLPFTKGDVITVLEEMNGDWWRGTLNGRTGIFPSNFVERLPPTVPINVPPYASSNPPPPSISPYNQTLNQPQGQYNSENRASEAYNSGYNQAPPYSQQQQWNPPPPAPQQFQGPGGYPQPSYGFPQNSQYTPPPPPQHQSSYAPYQPYAVKTDLQHSASPAPPAPATVVVVGPPPIPEKKKFGAGMGKVLATSMVGGLGFGAGSAVASEAIHKIF